jgi:hypothetical protein
MAYGGAARLAQVGYDASPYAVAKSLVLVEMMAQGAASGHVLQVWYSAAWSQDTSTAFQSAVSALLQPAAGADGGTGAGPACAGARQGAGQQQPLPQEVLSCLQHWQGREVALVEARKAWMASVTRELTYICNFK